MHCLDQISSPSNGFFSQRFSVQCLLFILIKIEAHHKASPVHEVNQFKTDLNVRYALKNLKKRFMYMSFFNHLTWYGNI